MAEAYKVVITQRAQDSLEYIIDYLRESASDETARKVRNAIEKGISELVKMPTANPLLKGTKNNFIVYRRALVWSYRIIYTLEENELLVIVVDIDHERMNPVRLEDLP
jgi:plasmid stabilization system protein ParE